MHRIFFCNWTNYISQNLWNKLKYSSSAAVVSSTSTGDKHDTVKLRWNRYKKHIMRKMPLSCMENKTWKDKMEYAAACYQLDTKEAFNSVLSLAREDSKHGTRTSNRLLYLAMDMALNHLFFSFLYIIKRLIKISFTFPDEIDIAEELFTLLPRHTHVLSSSLKIRFFVRQKRFWDAIREIENVLNNDTAGYNVSSKICKSVLDDFYGSISKCNDAVDESKRLFTLQRILSKYNKRTTKSLRELLLSDMVVLSEKQPIKSDLNIDDDLLDKIMEHVPEVLTDDRV
ncbi:unnamed protein product [Thelazia callipaeda]|uniref:Pentatricopeptide repeat-containing protein n=1 Tax=Thelazia callipaeda TaxID=103827 RepID=A0A0N5D2L5_THECL|nr:unnamed protein product [Thelazia callipaeda]